MLRRPNLWHLNDPETEPDDQEECDRLREVLAAVDLAAAERQVHQAAKWAGQRRHPRVHVGVELDLPGVEAQP